MVVQVRVKGQLLRLYILNNAHLRYLVKTVMMSFSSSIVT